MTVHVAPLPAPLGARITGVDLRRPLDEAALDAVRAAWLDHQVLIFPDQDLSEADQIAFSRRFGEFPRRTRFEGRNERDTADRSIMLVSNIRDNGEPIGSLPDGEMMFHSDGAYDDAPYKFTLLYAVELPTSGGNTLFANMYDAYDTLPDGMKQKLQGCHAMHDYHSGTVHRDRPVGGYSGDAVHPVFVSHDDTGRTAIFVSRLLTRRIVELDESESEALLDELFDHCERPTLLYEHAWTKGDFVMWDNRCVTHARTDFPRTDRRLLRRTVIQGDKPAMAHPADAALM
jgi:taurine dioxygenase